MEDGTTTTARFLILRGVIHRDLKPANVLVDEQHGDTVKILDFGLVRITEGHVAAATMTTELGVIGAPRPTCRPSRRRATRARSTSAPTFTPSAVMPCEMLAGRRPYDVLKKSLPEAVRVICEESLGSLSRTIQRARRLDSSRGPDDRCHGLGTAGGNGPSWDCADRPDRMIYMSRLPLGV